MARRRLALVVFAAMICGAPALASDWTIKSRLSQTFEANNNYFMVVDPAGTTYRSLSTIYLDSTYRTATTKHVLSGDLSYYKYTGPGAEDTQLKQGINNGAQYGFERFYKIPQDRDFLNAVWRRTDVASQQLADQGFITSRGSTNIYVIDGGFERKLTPRDTFTMIGRATANTFDNEEQNFTDILGSARIVHAFSAVTDFVASVDFDWFKYNDLQKTQTEFWKFLGGIVTRPTSQLTIRSNFGFALANTRADPAPLLPTAGAPVPPPPQPGDPLPPVDPNSPPPLQPVQGTGSGHTWIGDIYITYKAKTETYNLFASKYVSPNTFGALQERKTIGASVRHEINRHSGISLSSAYTITRSGQSSSNGEGTTVTQPADLNVVLSYDRVLTRELRGQLVYSYRVRFPDNQTPTTTTAVALPPPDNSPIDSHGIYAVISADVTLKP